MCMGPLKKNWPGSPRSHEASLVEHLWTSASKKSLIASAAPSTGTLRKPVLRRTPEMPPQSGRGLGQQLLGGVVLWMFRVLPGRDVS